MARSPLEKAKQQAADLKAGMNPEQWLKKWGFTTSGGAYSKISRLRRRGLLPSDYTLGLKARPKLKGTKVPKKPVKPMKPLKPNEPIEPMKPLEPLKPVTSNLVKVHWEIPRSLLKSIKHKAITQDKKVIQVVREILTKGSK